MNDDDDVIDNMDRNRKPSSEGLAVGQVWAWMAGADPPRWEVRGTGLVLSPDEERAFRKFQTLRHFRNRPVNDLEGL
jgi:hypothetical protein